MQEAWVADVVCKSESLRGGVHDAVRIATMQTMSDEGAEHDSRFHEIQSFIRRGA